MTTRSLHPTFSFARLQKALALPGSLILLFLSWAVLFKFFALMTNLLLPYDTSWYEFWGWPQGSPPPGSWQRSLSYFFESPLGSILPALLVVGLDALILAIVLFLFPRLRANPSPLLLGFAATNFIIMPVMFWATYAASSWAGNLAGWSSTLLAWLPTLFLLILLYAIQGLLLPRKLAKVRRTSEVRRT